MAESQQAKGQSALEYILIVAITFVIIVPTTYLFYSYSRESGAELSDAQVTKIGRTIVDTSTSIFYSGVGSKTTVDVNIPDSIKGARIIDGKELVFNMTTTFGETDLVFFSSVNLTTTGTNCANNVCKIPELGNPGVNKVKIEAVSTESVSIVVI